MNHQVPRSALVSFNALALPHRSARARAGRPWRRLWLWLAFLVLPTLAARAVVLTQDTALAPLDTSCEGQDVVVSNCVLTVDGPHTFASLKLLGTATLNHSPATNGLVTITASISNELQVLTGTNPVPLLFSNVVTASVVVSDTNNTLIYTQPVDYVLGASNQFTTLQRTDTSAIPDGASVLVSYSYTVGSTNGGLNLTVTGDLEVAPGARVAVDGLGRTGNFVGCGGSAGSPLSGGGGTHAGYGGLGVSQARCGVAYDSLVQPAFPGGSGGSGTGGAGGAGGGLVFLNIGGTATINGLLSANGIDATNSRAGGGSGGGIWLTAQTLSGSGNISADGGAGESVYGGGGGGGCIALYFATNHFAGSLYARGGNGFIGGGAGTIYQQATDLSQRQVTVDNGGRAGTNSALHVTNGADVLVSGGALLSPSGSQTLGNLVLEAGTALVPLGPLQSVTLTASNVTVQAGAEMLLDGAGDSAGAGSGKGSGYTSGGVTWGSGAGHGGVGGWGGGVMYWGGGGSGSLLTDMPGASYGSATSPTTFGSGGGGYTGQYVLSAGTPLGGAGGGVLSLTVLGTLLLDGRISANGLSGVQAGGGGGAGGSLWLTAGTLAGSGTLSANGGNGVLPHAGGGAGGRIALGFATNGFIGTISAYGGSGTNWGGAGTLYFKPSGQPGTLVLDNGGHSGSFPTPISLSGTDALTLQGAAQAQVTGLTVSGLVIRSNSVLSFNSASLCSVTANGDVAIEKGGLISVNGMGTLSSGLGGTYGSAGGGAGHGGYGAAGADPRAGGGLTYGSILSDQTMGSTGGGYSNGSGVGGNGGGALLMTVTGALRLDGTISADATAATASGGGGGSGGSVGLRVGQLSGEGTVSANGGDGGAAGGGGGGGRVNIIYTSLQTNSFTGLFCAYGGHGVNRGGAGTVSISPYQQPAQVLVDNGGLVGATTPSSLSGGISLTVKGGGRAVCSGTLLNLLVGSNATVSTFSPGSGFNLTVTGDATIDSGGLLAADGLGLGSGSGAGRYCSSGGSSYGGGGTYGGIGGAGAAPCAAGGPSTFSQATVPTAAGSGCYDSSLGTGSYGGGSVLLAVTGTLLLNGAISANGTTNLLPGAGGGAGGGIWLHVGTLAGSGLVSANGGNGAPGRGGGGGGGRIAITYNTNNFTGVLSARGGMGWQNGGAGTVYTKANAQSSGQLVLDNGGMIGTNSPLWDSGGLELVISGGAVVRLQTSSPSFNTLTIRSNSVLSLANLYQTVFTGIATVDPGGVITSDGFGYTGGSGPGAGSSAGALKGGGGHGGVGGGNLTNGGGANDSLQFPAGAGSGGGNGSGGPSAPYGGAGGGGFQLQVSGLLTVNGRISADGLAGDTNSGGGSGGSLLLTVGTLAGNGSISANGGAGTGTAGGGGGGRIAIYYTQNSFSGTLSALGGSGNGGRGGAGTIYSRSRTSTVGQLLVDNGGLPGTNTPLGAVYNLPVQPFDLTLQGGAAVQALNSPLSLSNLVVSSGSTLTASSAQTNLMLLVQGNLALSTNSAIVVDGEGYGVGTGPGAGGTNSNQGSGAGYGGPGGASTSGAPGGTAYGSATQPVDRGSGGGAGAGPYAGGSEGGGALYVVVNGTLDLEGRISANGNAGLQLDAGGGSGGSLCITAGALTGNGLLLANGGAGAGTNGGGGGGGRIALYSPANTFAGLASASGGPGASPGSDGTIFTSSAFLLPLIQGTVHDTNGQPVAGVQLQASGGQPTATTDANGAYSLGVSYGWTGSLTPSLPNLSFVPGTRSFTNVLANVTGQDFLLVPTIVPVLSAGWDGTNLSAHWSGILGVTYQTYWSSNLVDWLPWGTLIPGSNGILSTSLPLTNAPQGFFRLKATN